MLRQKPVISTSFRHEPRPHLSSATPQTSPFEAYSEGLPSGEVYPVPPSPSASSTYSDALLTPEVHSVSMDGYFPQDHKLLHWDHAISPTGNSAFTYQHQSHSQGYSIQEYPSHTVSSPHDQTFVYDSRAALHAYERIGSGRFLPLHQPQPVSWSLEGAAYSTNGLQHPVYSV